MSNLFGYLDAFFKRPLKGMSKHTGDNVTIKIVSLIDKDYIFLTPDIFSQVWTSF